MSRTPKLSGKQKKSLFAALENGVSVKKLSHDYALSASAIYRIKAEHDEKAKLEAKLDPESAIDAKRTRIDNAGSCEECGKKHLVRYVGEENKYMCSRECLETWIARGTVPNEYYYHNFGHDAAWQVRYYQRTIKRERTFYPEETTKETEPC